MAVRSLNRNLEREFSLESFSEWSVLRTLIDTLSSHPGLIAYKEKLAKDCVDRDTGVVEGVYGAKEIMTILDLPEDFLKRFTRRLGPELFPGSHGLNGKQFWMEYVAPAFSFFPVIRISTGPEPRECVAEITLIQHVPHIYRRRDGSDFSLKQLQAWGGITCAELSTLLKRLMS